MLAKALRSLSPTWTKRKMLKKFRKSFKTKVTNVFWLWVIRFLSIGFWSFSYSQAGDISEEVQCKKIVDETVKRFHRIDILVNNAAYQGKYLVNLSWDFVLIILIFALRRKRLSKTWVMIECCTRVKRILLPCLIWLVWLSLICPRVHPSSTLVLFKRKYS